MRLGIILLTVFVIMIMVTLSFADVLPAHGVTSGSNETLQQVKKALPSILLLAVFLINLVTSLIDPDRSFKVSLLATIILVGITYWGGFYIPLLDFLNAKIPVLPLILSESP